MVGTPSVATNIAPAYRLSLVRVEEGQEAAWLAEVDGLPSCSARGATPEEAVRDAWAAAQGLLGQPFPEEGSPQEAPRHSGKLLVRMPATLHDELARTAEIEGVSLNQLITGALASAVEWRSNDGSVRERDARRAALGDAVEDARPAGVTRVVLAANFAVVVLAALVAITLLITAWRG